MNCPRHEGHPDENPDRLNRNALRPADWTFDVDNTFSGCNPAVYREYYARPIRTILSPLLCDVDAVQIIDGPMRNLAQLTLHNYDTQSYRGFLERSLPHVHRAGGAENENG